MRRLPRTVLGGRARTSTVLLLVAFLGVLTLWVSVRPSTQEVVVRQTRTITTQDTELPRRAPVTAATRRPTPTPTPLATANNGKASSAPGTVPAPLPVAPPPDATPGQSPAPTGSLSQILPPGQATPAPPPPTDAAAPPDTAPPTYP